ncbi:hypothetical protein [Nocardia alni]|uniref:hypothetical protein n=1 Tax=Nocardia alni TaxID=2815723 RepID=UPI001C24BC87|nr:hypothetical protein [Nocardia alni]
MTTAHNTRTKRLVATLGVAAAAVAPVLLFAGAGIAHADDPGCLDGGALQGSYYCSPMSGPHATGPDDSGQQYAPVQPPFGMNNLPQCSGGALAGIVGALNGEGC